jgi:hypothetical protein
MSQVTARVVVRAVRRSLFWSADILVRLGMDFHERADKNVRAPSRQQFERRKRVSCAH